MKDNPKRLKFDKYCRFHRDRGHTTEECHHLKNVIEKLIRRGHLRQYMNREQSRQPQETASTQHPNSDNLSPAGVIALISGGPARGDSANARKALVRSQERNNWQTPNQIHNINSDKQGEIAFGVDNAQLRKVNTPLTGFSGEMIEPLGEVTLPLSLGSYPKRSTKMVKFLVVKAPSTYHIILCRPSLNLFCAIASTFHMKLKFPTSDGVGEAVGDERMARECYEEP
ncbi:hypothetical protein Sango_1559200 [Sesamum angolense]|uniref:Reverse transcriptase domain-containing protein n=1 Tax=Sesamum angolense TaxID=2727404 RepID=A0AAE1WPK8_9LAMI|nr:hypothetical protein Sango_1559200 [Sesamum angolense]